MDSVEFFRSADILVRAVKGLPGDTLVVTSSSYTDHFDLDREGFGQGFFRSRAGNAVHVINRTNACTSIPSCRRTWP